MAQDMPTKVGLLLVYGRNFGQMPFLPPPMTGWGVPTGIEPRLAEKYEHQFKFLQVVVLEDYTGDSFLRQVVVA